MGDDLDKKLRKNAIKALFQAAGDVGCLGYRDFEHEILRMARKVAAEGDASVSAFLTIQKNYYVQS